MEKNEFKLIVTDITNHPGFQNMGFSLTVTAWDNSLRYMIDEGISEQFPELERIKLYDLQEGCMEYSGKRTADELAVNLVELGFDAKVGQMPR